MIIETLAIAIGKTITVHFLTLYLNTVAPQSSIEVDGAPDWYYQMSREEIASFANASGGLESIEVAKKEAEKKMEQNIQKTMEGMMYDFYKKAKTKEEEHLISDFEKDKNLTRFIEKYLTYPNIKYDEEEKKAFVKASIGIERLIEYEKDRLHKIQKALVKSREKDAFEDLEKEANLEEELVFE